MRHSSLHGNVLVISEKNHILLSNIKCDILGRKIKVNQINIPKDVNRLKNLLICKDRVNYKHCIDA